MNQENIAMIVEGDVREPAVIQNMISVFFRDSQVKLITLPAGQNIYMLWKQLRQDAFQTDIIEIVREYNPMARKMLQNYRRDDFSEVYLFFDYDGHQGNLGQDEGMSGDEVLKAMLQTFDNETDQGKLYVSYPMAEALRDYVRGSCANLTGCFLSVNQFGKYKQQSAQNKESSHFSKYTFENWQDICTVFGMRASCLFGDNQTLSYSEFRVRISPDSIFSRELLYSDMGQIFVLSAFPEFLLDYHKERFWNKMVRKRRNARGQCDQLNMTKN